MSSFVDLAARAPVTTPKPTTGPGAWGDPLNQVTVLPIDRKGYARTVKTYEIFNRELEKEVAEESHSKKNKQILEPLSGPLARIHIFDESARVASEDAPQVRYTIWGMIITDITLALKKSKELKTFVDDLTKLADALPNATPDLPYLENPDLKEALRLSYVSFTVYLGVAMIKLYGKSKTLGFLISKPPVNEDLARTLTELEHCRGLFDKALAGIKAP